MHTEMICKTYDKRSAVFPAGKTAVTSEQACSRRCRGVASLVGSLLTYVTSFS